MLNWLLSIEDSMHYYIVMLNWLLSTEDSMHLNDVEQQTAMHYSDVK